MTWLVMAETNDERGRQVRLKRHVEADTAEDACILAAETDRFGRGRWLGCEFRAYPLQEHYTGILDCHFGVLFCEAPQTTES